MIVLGGTSLTCAEVAAIGRRLASVEIGEEGRVRAGAAAALARAAAERAVAAGGAVYGRTTGVGYNRGVEVTVDDQQSSGLRLLRSHSDWPCSRSGLTR
jgi:histidine ammonia-lyase